MNFSEWFDAQFRRAAETRTAAMARLHVKTGVSPMSIRRALAGTKVRGDVARRLSKASRGLVSARTLTDAPPATAGAAATATGLEERATDPADERSASDAA